MRLGLGRREEKEGKERGEPPKPCVSRSTHESEEKGWYLVDTAKNRKVDGPWGVRRGRTPPQKPRAPQDTCNNVIEAALHTQAFFDRGHMICKGLNYSFPRRSIMYSLRHALKVFPRPLFFLPSGRKRATCSTDTNQQKYIYLSCSRTCVCVSERIPTAGPLLYMHTAPKREIANPFGPSIFAHFHEEE